MYINIYVDHVKLEYDEGPGKITRTNTRGVHDCSLDDFIHTEF